MDILSNLLNPALVEKLGWTLVHFIWQATVIAIILAIVLRTLKKRSANLKYLISCIGLIAILICPLVTINMIEGATVSPLPVIGNTAEMPEITLERPVVEISAKAEITPAPIKASLIQRFMKATDASLPYLVSGWLIGVFGLSIWHLGGWMQLQKLRKRMVKPVSERINLRLQSIAERMGIKRTVSIMESALANVPMAIGHLKPVILLPASALTGLSGEQIEAIIAHELAHVKRCDYLVNIFQTVIEILGFYHPAVWWVSHKIRGERENCCDDIAVRVCSDNICYAKALTTMEEIRTKRMDLAVAASGGNLFNRVRRLLGKDPHNEKSFGWLPSVIAILLIVILLIPAVLALSDSRNELEDKDDKELIVYQVNRSVADFPDKEDFSTPESAYVAINRVMATDGPQGWVRVSRKSLANRLSKIKKKNKVDTEWANVVLNAKILEVRIHGDEAVVLAEYPQKLSSKPIESPIDYRHLVYEDGKWLNTGQNRYQHIENARAKFEKGIEEKKRAEQAYNSALDKSEIFVEMAKELFEDLRKTNFKKVLGYYNKETGDWKKDGWKKVRIWDDYMVHTNWPAFSLWVCKTFKDNPIESVKLGDVFISEKKNRENYKLPAVPYKLVLSDGGILEGELYFYYWARSDEWQAGEGIDWHLMKDPIKRVNKPVINIKDRLIVPGIEENSEYKQQILSDNFKATLPNGVTVKLLGICEHPSEGKQWWRPDGSLLEQRPYEIKNVAISKMLGRKVLETVIKVEGFDDGIGLRYNIEGKQNSGSSGSGDQKFNGIVFDQAKESDETNISVGVAAGQWETVQTQETNFGGVYSYRDVIWHAPVETNGKTVLNTAHTKIGQNVRFVAVDKEGKEHRSGSTSSIKEGLESMQTTFDLPLSEIKEFKFQIRPYEYVTFKNVCLKPDFQTDVQIEVENANQELVINPQRLREKNEKQVYLPNIDRILKILELDTGRLIRHAGVEDDEALFARLDHENNSAVMYDADQTKGKLAFFRCEIIDAPSEIDEGLEIVTFDFDKLPVKFNVKTLKGSKYHVNIEKADDYQCQLEYYEFLAPQSSIMEDTQQKHRRYFVTIVAGSDKDKLGYQGQQITWENLEEELQNLSDKKDTVLEVAFEPEVIPKKRSDPSSYIPQWLESNEAFKRAGQLVEELGLEYLSFVGPDHPSTRRGPISIRTEDKFNLDEEILVGLRSFEEKALLNIRTVEFSKSYNPREKNRNNLNAKLKVATITWLQKFWEVGVRLLDKQGNQIDSVVRTYDNKGIARGRPLRIADEMEFKFGQTDIEAVDRFEVKLREFLKPETINDKATNNEIVPQENKGFSKPIERVIYSSEIGKEEIEISARFIKVSDINEIMEIAADKEEDLAEDIKINPENTKALIIDDEQEEAILRYVQIVEDTVLITAPRALVIDGEIATVRSQKLLYYDNVNSDTGEKETKELKVGTMMMAKPKLTDEGKNILLELELEQKDIIGGHENIPEIEVNTIKSKVKMPEGKTIIMILKREKDKNLICMVGMKKVDG